MIDKSYQKVRAHAQAQADATGFDWGVEAVADGATRCWSLPRAEHRFGHELRCEVAHPTRLDVTQPGHGHAATSAAMRRAFNP